jgi:protoporphyrinogen oxidase
MYFDIVVIGLGISGLYFGLKTLNTNKKILFVEKENRVGGRLISLKLDEETPYYAEGGAQRFFKNKEDNILMSLENDNILFKLLEELNIDYTILPNDKLISSNKYIEIYKNVKKIYPEKNRNISFPSAITISNYNNNAIKEFIETIGYPLFETQINLDMAYSTLDKITLEKQNFINGGYENVCKKMFEILKTKHQSFLNYTISKIDYNPSTKLYTINNSIHTNKIVYTGTIKQLYNINTNIIWLNPIKKIFKDYYIEYSAIKIFIKLENPFWTEDEYFTKINTSTLLNQLLFINSNTILIYSNMESAKTLYNLDKYNKFEWTSPLILKNITQYIQNTFTQLFNKNIKIFTLAYRYNDVAAQFSSPIPINIYNNLQQLLSYNDFFFISGDYTNNPGWVNSCLYSVETNLLNIIS